METTILTLSPIDFVDRLKQILENTDEFNFSMLAEMNPIKKKYTYVCKVLSIIVKFKSENKPKYIHYDKILEHSLNYIEIKENHMRKVGARKLPFWLDGSSTVQTFKGNEFIEYSLRNPTRTDLTHIEKIRSKYNIPEPHEFIGEKLGFEDDLDL
jgi:hypothetical protein